MKDISTAGLFQDKRFQTVKERLTISFFVLIIYSILSFLHVGCPIRFTTGLSCPGCGMTRSILAVLRFDFTSAFYYHPLFALTPFMFFLFLFEAFIQPKVLKVSWTIIVSLFIIIYILRLFIFRNNIVTFDIYNSIVVKLINKLIVGGYL